MGRVRPVVYDIYVNGRANAVNGLVLDVEIRQEWGHHDLVFVRAEIPRPYTDLPNYRVWPDNAPVEMVFGRGAEDIKLWYGYVNHHEFSSESDSGSGTVQITYVLIGTSAVLNSDDTASWPATSYSYIARQIAKKHKLRAIVTACPNTVGYEAQAGESDFSFLNRLAELVGFRFWVSGPNLYFVDPNVLLSESAVSSVRRFTMDKKMSRQDTLKSFDIVKGENIPGRTVTKKTVYGIDKGTNRLIRASSGAGEKLKVNVTRPVSSYQEAKYIADGEQNFGKNWVLATATVNGTTSLEPGRVVLMDGDAMTSGNSGYWLIGAVKHKLKGTGTRAVRDIYVTDLTLIRNTPNQVDFTSEWKISRNQAMTLQDNQWKSEDLEAVIRV